MSRVYFVNTLSPCVDNEITRWHLAHGWLWDVYDRKLKRNIGVFFCTLLCGDGCIIHFDCVPELSPEPVAILSAFRSAVDLVSPDFNVVFATIPSSKNKLISCICRMGFSVCCDAKYWRDGQEITLLKYLPHSK